MNMIVGKRQIILMALVLGLGIAVYLNWIYADGGNDFVLTGKMSETKNYGDAQYVDPPWISAMGKPTSPRRRSPEPNPGMKRWKP